MVHLTQALLDIFKHFTGDKDAELVSIGGGTNAKLFDNALSFGPSMPGKSTQVTQNMSLLPKSS